MSGASPYRIYDVPENCSAKNCSPAPSAFFAELKSTQVIDLH